MNIFYADSIVTMVKMKVTRRNRGIRVEVSGDLPRMGHAPSIVSGPSRATIETPWIAVVGLHACRPQFGERVVSNSFKRAM